MKRTFDLVFSVLGLLLTGWLIAVAWLLAAIDTRENGFFLQHRVGRHGKLFRIVKIRTMRTGDSLGTTVTTRGDPRITALGAFWRATKIDELPQLWNIVKGDMSFVGPRPDVPGYADRLEGEARALLSVRPGVTGPATIKYKEEEKLLAAQRNPEEYNDTVIYPDKVRMNLEYIASWKFSKDLRYIWVTLTGSSQ